MLNAVNETEKIIQICPNCEKEVEREDMLYTRDCQGIRYRLVCYKCHRKLMAKGYDGAFYTAADECLDWDY
jgi:hypothetical protein